jgi:2-polyprenyl-6-methoxyphenol hydroxylase-like FAD-dependent oxidoreductase
LSRPKPHDIAVLGGGAAGLVAALTAAKSARTVLVLNRPFDPHAPFRIDAIPARTLALLVEFGITPSAIGAERLHDRQQACWATELPQWSHGPQTAHVERPALEAALFDLVRGSGGIDIVVDRVRPKYRRGFTGTCWSARHLIDATGRAAVTAQARLRPRPAWGSRFFWTRRTAVRATPEFRIAALPGGYAYRLGSADHIGIGLVGRGALLKSDAAALGRLLRQADAQWLCEDMPPLESMVRGSSGVTSVQWAVPGHAVLIGDASIARDPLSSQGLAASLSDALYAVAAIFSGDTASLRARQAENLRAHLTCLKAALRQCRYLDNAHWTAYEGFIAANITGRVDRPASALRHGRLEMMPEY